jgi:hypothetical protein
MALSNEVANLFNNAFGDKVKISRISPDLRGKSIVIYGGNNVGKTTQAAKFKNPVFMPFEKGMNAISGALVLRNANWADTKSNIKKLSSRKFTDALRKGEQITIIWDGFERAGFYCQRYIEQKYDAFDVADARKGFGAWTQYEKEFWTEVDKLLNLGFTVVFVGHADIGGNKKNKEQIYPKGDKRCVAPIVDNADIVVYVEANGVDEKGNEIPSSAYFIETDEYFARSRFTYVKDGIKEFTAESFEQAIIEGIQEQLEVEGEDGVTFEEQQQIYSGEDIDHPTLVDQIKELYTTMKELKLLADYEDIIEEHLGEGVKVSDTSAKQIEPLICIREALQDIIDEVDTDEETEDDKD